MNRRNGDPLAVLVTGGAGFVGSHVADALHSLGWHVEVLDNLSSGDPANVPLGVRLRVGDIRSSAERPPSVWQPRRSTPSSTAPPRRASSARCVTLTWTGK